ncbi:MAG TPA: restriction endonuclease, partial [Ktedonobacterales bacterium]|nr:restriction endonuclease [Ktedonobacterales bacterium]
MSLAVEQVDALTPGMWAALVRWLLERDGTTVERVDHGASEIILHGEGADGHVVAVAQRLSAGWALGEVEVKRAASLCAGSAGARAVLIANAPASAQARAAAARLGVQLLDREYLRERLAVLAQSYQRERENAAREAAARATAAATARERMLAALHG